MTKDEKIEVLTTHLEVLANKIERGEEIDPSAAIIIRHDLRQVERESVDA